LNPHVTDIELYNEILKTGLEFVNSFDNGTHLIRMCARYHTKRGYSLITLDEYNFLQNLSIRIHLDINLKKTLWYWGGIINEGEWSLITCYTSQPQTFFNDLNRIDNVITNNNIFHYYNRPILLRNTTLLSFVDISNDINLTPNSLINTSIRTIVDNSLSMISDIHYDMWRDRNYQIIEFDGNSFRLNILNNRLYDSFSNRSDQMIRDIDERSRQIRNITGYGEGYRRLQNRL